MFTLDALIRRDPEIQPPRLLVSVRSRAEVDDALRGGAQILDIKDPSRGSLGCAGPDIIGTIQSSEIPVTAALGECLDWSDASPFPIPEHVTLVKLGLAGLRRTPAWVESWQRARRLFETASNRRLNWVAVAYVDVEAAGSPLVDDIATSAIETGCTGLLLDTFGKHDGRLFDHVNEQQLVSLTGRMHDAGKFLAAAGRLRVDDVARLRLSPVDVVAVRSAACTGHDRTSAIDSARVAACRAALAQPQRNLSAAY